MFQSIAKILSKDLYDKDDNSTSGQALILLIIKDILDHVHFRLKSFNYKFMPLENKTEIEIGIELFKFLLQYHVLNEYEKDGVFNNYTFHEDFDKNSKKMYENILKYSSPFFEPMIVHPLPWTSIDNGGYLKDEKSCSKFDLNIMKTQSKNDRLNLEAKRENFSPKLLEAVNIIQSTKWRINTSVLNGISKKFNLENKELAGKLKILRNEYKELGIQAKGLEKYIKDTEALKIAKKEIYQEKKKINKEINKVKNDFQIISLVYRTAEKYKQYEEIYFVYQIDFRGRLYPIQALLSPIGDDLSKSLLHFATKQKINDKGLKWFKIHGANKYGKDKISFDERVAWIDKYSKEIGTLSSMENPFESNFLQDADKPYQFLAFAYEYAEYLSNPTEFYSSLPIAVDGSNNGFQHISALLRDNDGAKRVNVLPNGKDIPADIYQDVAEMTKRQLIDDKKTFATLNEKVKDDVRAFIDDILPFIDRSLVKQNVMTDSYGAGEKAKAFQIADNLKKVENSVIQKNIKTISKYLAKLNDKSIDKLAPSANKYKKWMKKIAKEISEQNRAIEWTTPLIELKITQEEFITKDDRISTKYNGKENKLQIKIPTDKINMKEQIKGIAPNFIHSLDATHMYLSILSAHKNGVKSFATIHDSFATHANDVDTLIEALKNEFIALTKYDILLHFKKEIENNYGIEIEKIPYVDKEKFNIELLEKSQYFFA
jgi:DNA-directed RNA polymerase